MRVLKWRAMLKLTLLARATMLIACAAIFIACASAPTSVPVSIPTSRVLNTPQSVVIADATPTPSMTPTTSGTTELGTTPAPTIVSTATPTPTPTPSFLQQQITNLFDLSRLPVLQNTRATQYTSRNWVSQEYYFDYFIDDGNFDGPNYGYIGEDGKRHSYRIVTGYDGNLEYEIIPRVEGPGEIARIWLAYQQHQSYNNSSDMSANEEWSNWGNLGAMGNIRFYFDDELTPRINMGIKDLFVGKNPFPAPLAAFYASANGGNINYVPIPFARSIRVTTTGRPRLMQIEVKRFLSNSSRAETPSTFSLNLSSAEQSTLEQAAQAWQTCSARLVGDHRSFPLGIAPENSAAVDFLQPGTVAGFDVRVPRDREESVWLQVFWDGDIEPSINAPIRVLFGTAERLLPYSALPLGTIIDGSDIVFYNYFPMPFRSARFVFVNHSDQPLPLTFNVVLREPTPGAEEMRFHAFYGKRRVERREDNGDNYVVIDVPGTGKYVGLILSAWDLNRQALNMNLPQTWRFPYLESNMDVWIDGRLALPGTGIEDDFNASYYYVFTGYLGYNSRYCLSGVTLLDYSTHLEPSSQYRFYLNDAPEFRDRLRVEVQHGNKGNNLSVTYSSTAFWYQMK